MKRTSTLGNALQHSEATEVAAAKAIQAWLQQAAARDFTSTLEEDEAELETCARLQYSRRFDGRADL